MAVTKSDQMEIRAQNDVVLARQAVRTWAAELGFHFVDLKHCHGYLGHEFLSAFTREGEYGGSLVSM